MKILDKVLHTSVTGITTRNQNSPISLFLSPLLLCKLFLKQRNSLQLYIPNAQVPKIFV